MDLQSFLDRFGDVSQQGDGWLAHCPSHSDSDPSLRLAVTPDGTALVKCRAGCETVDVLSAVGLSFSDLRGVDVLGGVTIRSEAQAPLEPAAIARLRVALDNYAGLSDVTAEYARRRFGVDVDTAARLGLGTATDLPGGERLVVPFCDPDGVARGFQARAVDPAAAVRWYGPKNPEQGSWSRLGWFSGGSTAPEIIITEGPGDALTVASHGYDAIAVRGAGLAGAVVDQIMAWGSGRPVVVAGDGDAAGRQFTSTLVTALSDAGTPVSRLTLPEGQDVSDVFLSDPDGFQRFLIGAISSASPVVGAEAILMERDLALFPLTDLGNARFTADLAEREGTPLRYVEEMGFIIYSGGVWSPDFLDRSRSIVHRTADRVRSMAEALTSAAVSDEEIAEAKRWMRWSDYCQSKRGIDSALSELVALPLVATRLAALDRHHHLLVVRNGVVDLRTGMLQEHNQELLLTKRVEVDFDPEAKAPRWESYLSEVMMDDAEMVGYLRRLVGYSITGETSEQSFTVLWGSGANGKTVFTATLNEIFRAIAVTTPFSTFEQKSNGGIPNDLAALRAARLVFAHEGNAGKPMDEALLKAITGRDAVTARFLRKEFFSFQPRFQIFLSTNNKPSFVGQDEGLWRRVKMIQWRRYFAPDERDAGIFDALLEESQGILAWAVRGSVEWYQGGLKDPQTIKDATREYQAASDVLAGFLPGVYVRDESSSPIPGKSIFDDYLQWAEAENLKPMEIVKRRSFYSMLEERGVVRHAVRDGAAFAGIRRARPSDWVGDA